MFVSAYGAEAGNLGLRGMATSGVYLGGGIAPKSLPALESGLFMEAFRDKEPMAHLVATIPVAVLIGLYMRNIRPGRVLEGTLIGIALLIVCVVGGFWVDQSPAMASIPSRRILLNTS